MSNITTFEELSKRIREIYKRVSSEFKYSNKKFISGRIYTQQEGFDITSSKRGKYTIIINNKKKQLNNLNDVFNLVILSYKVWGKCAVYFSPIHTNPIDYYYRTHDSYVKDHQKLIEAIAEKDSRLVGVGK